MLGEQIKSNPSGSCRARLLLATLPAVPETLCGAHGSHQAPFENYRCATTYK